MKQDIAIKRVLRDLKISGLISEGANGEVKIYLDALWVAGWEQARRENAARTEKPITQYDASGHKMEVFDSIEKAAKQMRCSRETIARAIKMGRRTARGHIWKFKEDEEAKI